MKTIAITGVTGTMGSAVLEEFIKNKTEHKLKVLVMPHEKDKVKKYKKYKYIEVVYGDLTSEESINYLVKDSDYFLHIGALVSPMADDSPKLAFKVNFGSTKLIVKAIKELNPELKLVYIGTVAETGDRPSPIHFSRIGDPIKTSVFDYYAESKVASERLIIDSGIENFVVLRQTGILPVNQNTADDPIIFHQNLNNVIEWITKEESARMLYNLCTKDLDKSFWKKVYNIGGGEKWRFSFYELMSKMMSSLDVDLLEVYNPKLLANSNFHGAYFLDSDILNDYLDFRYINPDEYFEKSNKKIRAIKKIPLLNQLLPTTEKMKEKMDLVAKKPRGPLWMLEQDKTDWINAFYGNKVKMLKQMNSEDFLILDISKEETYLNHGYDETKEILDIDDIKKAAEYRGYQLLSTTYSKDLYEILEWVCDKGHIFKASPYLILKAGHLCDECQRTAWNYGNMSKNNLFFAQVWDTIHSSDESLNIIKEVNDLNYE